MSRSVRPLPSGAIRACLSCPSAFAGLGRRSLRDRIDASGIDGQSLQPQGTAGARLLYLPPYSPDFNPIENAFAKLKALLRKAEARTREDLWDAITGALKHFSAQECANYFNAAGYELA